VTPENVFYNWLNARQQKLAQVLIDEGEREHRARLLDFWFLRNIRTEEQRKEFLSETGLFRAIHSTGELSL
jgi:hypothetical protein